MGASTYVGPGEASYNSVDDTLAALADGAAWLVGATIQPMTILATYYGLKDVAYETGPAIAPTGGASDDAVALAAARDPGIEPIVEDMLNIWYSEGGDLAIYSNGPYGAWTPTNEWPAAELYQAGDPALSPKYRAWRTSRPNRRRTSPPASSCRRRGAPPSAPRRIRSGRRPRRPTPARTTSGSSGWGPRAPTTSA